MRPVLFRIGNFCIYSYGFMFAIAVSLVAFLCWRMARREGLNPEDILDLFIWLIVGGLIGARAFYVIGNFRYYSNNLFEILMVQRGGLVFFGGFFGGMASGIIACIIHKLPFWKTADIIALYAPLGHSIGRIGCFLNGCCYGKPAENSLFLAIFPGENITRIPTQIYTSAALLMVFILLRVIYRYKSFEGQIFSLYLIFYAVQRFGMEFIRGDNRTLFLDLAPGQILAFLLFLSGLLMFLILSHGKNRHNS